MKSRAASAFIGKSVLSVDKELSDAAVEAIFREGKTIEIADTTTFLAGDGVALTGTVEVLKSMSAKFGREIVAPAALHLVQESREIILTNKALSGRAISALHDHITVETRHGVFLTSAKRMGLDLPILGDLELKTGDELHFAGSPKDLDRVQSKIGYKISAGAATDFIFFGIGMLVGMLIGMIEFKMWGVPISIGSGGGCLLSGLFFGWLRSVHPHFAALPHGRLDVSARFRLGGVRRPRRHRRRTPGPGGDRKIWPDAALPRRRGDAGPADHDVLLLLLRLRIRNPIEALACVAGGRSANPAFAALLQAAGNATPVVSFTVTYAVANVFLTLWGPIIVGLVTKNAAP